MKWISPIHPQLYCWSSSVSENIAVLSGRKSQHGDSGLTPFIQNSMQIEKKKRFAWETICFWKKGCWVFVIVKNLNDTAMQPILGLTEIVKSGWWINPPPPQKKMAILNAQYFYDGVKKKYDGFHHILR